jgi:hypothetical protein
MTYVSIGLSGGSVECTVVSFTSPSKFGLRASEGLQKTLRPVLGAYQGSAV